ncbi:hypothetical protein SJ05684_c16560 [Sinorhizobium sojae CCBAU 05684]|uniref:Uncharacterized protein n=1 Tax=Sinorhizobium sojae CCBAU 05684 TaxID=716928 RepID=A0A249PAZ2_9HYPH|nr:hypothetical protein SJ05684_c16560 [Sinorhizobium sojae CCBAU 05684]
MRWQLRARGQYSVADRLLDLVCDARVDRAAALLYIREPSCHSDNYLYCLKFPVNYHRR